MISTEARLVRALVFPVVMCMDVSRGKRRWKKDAELEKDVADNVDGKTH